MIATTGRSSPPPDGIGPMCEASANRPLPRATTAPRARTAMIMPAPGRYYPAASMKILHVIGSLDPAAGGPPAIAARLAAAQAGLGHDVTLLSYASSAPPAAMTAAYD